MSAMSSDGRTSALEITALVTHAGCRASVSSTILAPSECPTRCARPPGQRSDISVASSSATGSIPGNGVPRSSPWSGRSTAMLLHDPAISICFFHTQPAIPAPCTNTTHGAPSGPDSWLIRMVFSFGQRSVRDGNEYSGCQPAVARSFRRVIDLHAHRAWHQFRV